MISGDATRSEKRAQVTVSDLQTSLKWIGDFDSQHAAGLHDFPYTTSQYISTGVFHTKKTVCKHP